MVGTLKLSHNEQYNYLKSYCRYGNIQDLKTLVRNYPDVITQSTVLDENGFCPLHHSCFYSHINIIKYLLDQNVDVNVPSSEGLRPLHFIARYPFSTKRGIEEQNNDFLQAFEALNMTNTISIEDRFTMTVESTMEDYLANAKSTTAVSYEEAKSKDSRPRDRCIEYLLEKNADINAKDKYGYTPLHHAIEKYNVPAVLELISDKECDINATTLSGETPLAMAVALKNKFLVTLLILEKAELPKSDNDQNSPVHVAAKEGDVKMLRLLINVSKKKAIHYLMINKKNRFGYTPLHLAVLCGNKACIRELIKNEANILEQTDYGENILHLATRAGNLEMIKYLAEEVNVPINIHDNAGQTLIHLSIAQENTEILKYLIKIGADIEERTFTQMTPYLIAIKSNSLDHFEILKRHKAKPTVTDATCRTAVHIAIENISKVILQRLLLDSKTKEIINLPDLNNNTPIILACQSNIFDLVKILLDNGADPTIRNSNGQICAHIAAQNGNENLLKLLIEKRGYIDDTDNLGNTPLHYAAKENKVECIRLLCRHGANIHKTNSENSRPFCVTIVRNNWKAMEFFLSNGIDLSQQVGDSLPPLHTACKEGREDIVDLLLNKGADPTLRVRSYFISVQDYSNALDIAIDHGNEDCARKIILKKQWFPKVMKNRTIDANDDVWSPMRKLICFMPNLALEVFDWCISTNKMQPSELEFEVIYNFDLIEDSFELWNDEVETKLISAASFGQRVRDKLIKALNLKDFKTNSEKFFEHQKKKTLAKLKSLKKNQHNPSANLISYNRRSYVFSNHPVKLMLSNNQEELIRHPLVKTLINLKWTQRGIYAYYFGLILFIILGVCFNAFMVQSDPAYILYPNITQAGNSTYCELTGNLRQKYYFFLLVFRVFILILAVISIGKNIVEMIIQYRTYLKNIINYIEMYLYISTIIVVLDFDDCSLSTGTRTEFQWQLGTVTTLVYWIMGCFYLQRIPFFGIYFILFTTVTRTFLKFILIFCAFVIGYAITFYLLFENKQFFVDTQTSIMKMFAMALGELDFNSIFYGDSEVYYKTVSNGIFFTFEMLISIVLMNLTIGLAVDDISTVMEQAKIRRLEMKTNLSLHIELVTLKKRKDLTQTYCYKVNKKKTFKEKIHSLIFEPTMPDFRSQRWNYKDNDDNKNLNEKDALANQLKSFKNQLKVLMKRNERRRDSGTD